MFRVLYTGVTPRMPLSPWQQNIPKGFGGSQWTMSAEKLHLLCEVTSFVPHTNVFDVLWGCQFPGGIMNENHKKEKSHYWFAFHGQWSFKIEKKKYLYFPNSSLAFLFFSTPFFRFWGKYKRGLRSLSRFHCSKLVMLMSVFKVCNGRARNDLFSLPIHC